jgi:hypothetical protein
MDRKKYEWMGCAATIIAEERSDICSFTGAAARLIYLIYEDFILADFHGGEKEISKVYDVSTYLAWFIPHVLEKKGLIKKVGRSNWMPIYRLTFPDRCSSDISDPDKLVWIGRVVEMIGTEYSKKKGGSSTWAVPAAISLSKVGGGRMAQISQAVPGSCESRQIGKGLEFLSRLGFVRKIEKDGGPEYSPSLP